MKNKINYGTRGNGKTYKATIEIAKTISQTYKIPFNVVIKELQKI